VAKIELVTDRNRDVAVDLLSRFFEEEGFATPRDRIARNLARIIADNTCWAALLIADGKAQGVVTVTTMLYVEWGRLGEIGDLYVAPEYRGHGFAKLLIAEAIEWCRNKGCSAVSVVITPDGEKRHRLSQFYAHLEFKSSGRTIMSKMLS
jgi:GNAT superfamily N-acetyltransferase